MNLIYNKRKEITMEKGTLLDAGGKIIPPPKSKDETKPFILVDGGLHLKKEIRTEILRRMKESSNSAILDLTMLDDKQKEELKEFEESIKKCDAGLFDWYNEVVIHWKGWAKENNEKNKKKDGSKRTGVSKTKIIKTEK